MFRKDGSWVKKQKIEEVWKKISAEFPNTISVEKLVLWCEVELGLSKQKAYEYLDLVARIHNLAVDQGIIKQESDLP